MSRPAHRSYTTCMCSLLRKFWMTTRMGNGMPNQDQKFPYVLPDAGSDRRWCLQAKRLTLLVRLTARVSNRSFLLHPSSCHSIPFHARWCASGACLIGGEFKNQARFELEF